MRLQKHTACRDCIFVHIHLFISLTLSPALFTHQPTPTRKLVLEHCMAFRHNNAIIRAFRVGWRPFLLGMLHLLTLGGSHAVVALQVRGVEHPVCNPGVHTSGVHASPSRQRPNPWEDPPPSPACPFTDRIHPGPAGVLLLGDPVQVVIDPSRPRSGSGSKSDWQPDWLSCFHISAF